MTHPLTTALILTLAAAVAMAGCGNAQEPDPSSGGEVPGLLEVPADPSGGQPGASLMREAHTSMARAKGKMSVY
ncbi:MAG TPA: hypothetical protein VK972_10190, partial [Wenzhouxiangella sp.]|nr:hypothetical protein [Wenzhouxiangella sp.]